MLAQSAPVVVETNVQAVLNAHLHLDGRILLGQRFNALHDEILLVHLRSRHSNSTRRQRRQVRVTYLDKVLQK